MKKNIISAALAVLLTVCLAATAFADYSEGYFYYTIEDQSVTITGCFGKQAELTVPSMIAGCPVSHIASGAFTGNKNLKTVNLPDTIMSISEGAFDASITVNMTSSSGAGTGTEDSNTESKEETTDKTDSGKTEKTDTKETEKTDSDSKVTDTSDSKGTDQSGSKGTDQSGSKGTDQSGSKGTASGTNTDSGTSESATSKQGYDSTISVLQEGTNQEVSAAVDGLDETEVVGDGEVLIFDEDDSAEGTASAAETAEMKETAETEETAPTAEKTEADDPSQVQPTAEHASPLPFLLVAILAAAALTTAIIILIRKKQ